MTYSLFINTFTNQKYKMLPSYNIIGKNRLHFETIDSTNDFALELLSKTNPIEGTVVTADFQSMGKGQYGRVWQGMAHQNIAASVILYPNFLLPSEQFYLSKAIALGVKNFVEKRGISGVTVKWPNDIYIENKKTSGILIQNILTGNTYKVAIAGIGINVLQSTFDPQIPNPTSLLLNGLSEKVLLENLYESFFHELNLHYQLLKERNFELIDELYNNALWNKNQEVYFEVDGQKKSAELLKVGVDGKLELKDDFGRIVKYHHGEIKILV